MGLDPRDVDVPVVGGHAGVTILPLLSQVTLTISNSKLLPYLILNTSKRSTLEILNISNSLSMTFQVKPPSSFTTKEIEYLTDRIQNGGTEVVEVKFTQRKLCYNMISSLLWIIYTLEF